MIKAFLLVLSSIFLLFTVGTSRIFAQEPGRYAVGRIIEIKQETEIPSLLSPNYIQQLVLTEGDGKVVHEMTLGSFGNPITATQRQKIGNRVVLEIKKDTLTGNKQVTIIDTYRFPVLIYLFALFVVVVVVTSRLKGVTSLAGMVLSVVIILFFMVPQIIAGHNPVMVSVMAAGLISAVIVYFGHGFSKRAHLSLLCMLVTLIFVGLLSQVVVNIARLEGTGDETASFIPNLGMENINLQGLFLGGIILAALSVLDDGVISQVSVIYQLKQVKPKISLRELFWRGMEVGKDHISTLVNTLVLAYAGASLPLFILFSANRFLPIWVSLNDQMLAEEIVRTLAGSIGLVLSIPLTTGITSFFVNRKSI